ncbi:MAG: peptidoglycan DD-metalloendopeptidase family protein, partial [Bacteroidales bacterium]|nr:peptidoglycan DD-metalloendopeptidase family protein [Bacteroidales bacterium]
NNISNYMASKKIFIFVVLLLFAATFSVAQSRKSLEKKIKKQERALRLTTKLLKETKKKKKESYNKFLLIQKQIFTREELLANLQQDIGLLDEKISENEEIVNSLKQDLESLKEQYAKLIYFAWKNRSSYQQLMFILSAENFNQAFMRMKYLQQLTAYREKQAAAIKDILSLLESKVKELNDRKLEKEAILKQIEEEKIVLANEKQEQSKTVEKLKQKESELITKLKKQRKAAVALKKKVAKIIAEEARKAREAANKKHPNSKPATTKGFVLTPEEKIIAADFATNKSHLPWPTTKGIITGTFGTHEHPLIKGVKVNNDGVYISAPKGSKARVIFKGEVRKVFEIPGKHKLVLVRHGNYFSVYANLSEVFVKEGQKVSTKQEIGTVYTDPDDHKTVLELQIWKGSIKVNPQYWLAGH